MERRVLRGVYWPALEATAWEVTANDTQDKYGSLSGPMPYASPDLVNHYSLS